MKHFCALNTINIILVFITSFFSFNYIYSIRSVLRPSYKKLPLVVAYWDKNSCNDQDINKRYSYRSTHLQPYALFDTFNYGYFMSHQIPQGPIKQRNSEKTLNGSDLCSQIDHLIKEIKEKKTHYTDFERLKSNDFNYYMLSGTIILKSKHYPFIIKLFMENPRAFTMPFSKGWQPACFYIMNGGVSRYLAGFNRVPNLEIVNRNIQQDPYWCSKITTPRKWYYLPKNTRWFTVEGHNIGPNKYQSVTLPETYAVIADSIDKEKTLSINNRKDRNLGLKLCKFFGNRIDPHIDNFVIEKNTKKIALIDTEHFPSIVGLTKEIKFNTYTCWYSQLCRKFIADRWCRNKPYRKQLQKRPKKTIFPCFK